MRLLMAWDFEPSVVIGCIVLVAAFVAGISIVSRDHSQPAAQANAAKISHGLLFAAAIAVLMLALTSPVDVLADDYLFSAHMLQHMLLVLAVPPMLLMAVSPALAARILRVPTIARVERVLGRPVVAWTIANLTLWLWHEPTLYNAALADEDLHIFEHLCFLVAFTIFWWPFLAPMHERRIAPLLAVIYLVAATVSCSVLGILITFAPLGIFPAYLSPRDELGILPLIREWGLTPRVDQDLGGLLMWVGGGAVFLGAMIAALARWYAEPEGDIEFAPHLRHEEPLRL